jgi:putative transposase
VAATVIEDLVSRKWLAEIVSAEETSTQVQVVVTDALEAEGCWSGSPLVRTAWSIPAWMTRPGRCCWPQRHGPQMTSGSTREFMALCAIHQHFGRPGTPPTRPGSSRCSATSRPNGPT